MSLQRTVLILGAGASAHTGAPLMYDFLQVAEDLHRRETKDDHHFKQVLEARSQLQPVLAKAQFSIRNLEAVFGAFEMADLLKIPLASGAQALGDAMRHVIAVTLEQTTRFWFDGRNLSLSDGTYGQLVSTIRTLQDDAGHDISIITFNYDIALDFALDQNQFAIDYALPRSIGHPYARRIELLKLHGSLNWAKCAARHDIVCVGINKVLAYHGRRQSFDYGGGKVKLSVRGSLQELTCDTCQERLLPTPVIVPPTLHKLTEQHGLGTVWAQAAARLREADNIAIVGYSWPQNDEFFRHLFALGSMGPTILRKVIVLDKNPSVATRIESQLLGKQADFFAIGEEFSTSSINKMKQLLTGQGPTPTLTVIGPPTW